MTGWIALSRALRFGAGAIAIAKSSSVADGPFLADLLQKRGGCLADLDQMPIESRM
jgi:hypothetical protein